DHRLHIRVGGHVGADELRRAAGLLDRLHHLHALGLTARGDDDLRTLAGKGLSCRPADPGVASEDQHHLRLESLHGSSDSFVIWPEQETPEPDASPWMRITERSFHKIDVPPEFQGLHFRVSWLAPGSSTWTRRSTAPPTFSGSVATRERASRIWWM